MKLVDDCGLEQCFLFCFFGDWGQYCYYFISFLYTLNYLRSRRPPPGGARV